jgi:hypothetical protein
MTFFFAQKPQKAGWPEEFVEKSPKM